MKKIKMVKKYRDSKGLRRVAAQLIFVIESCLLFRFQELMATYDQDPFT